MIKRFNFFGLLLNWCYRAAHDLTELLLSETIRI